jgi:hypothetical protein
VLVEHRVDDVDEGLVAVEEAVPPGEQVALEPALAEVLGEDLHDASVRREVLVDLLDRAEPGFVGGVEDVAEAVRRRLIRTEEPEVVRVARHDVAQEPAEDARRLCERRRGRGDIDGVVAEVGEDEVAKQLASVRMRVRAHPAVAVRRLLGDLRADAALLVEELLGAVAAEPPFEPPKVVGALADAGERNLVRAPRALDGNAIDLARPRPALGRPQDKHRPARPRPIAFLTCPAVDLLDRVENPRQSFRKPLVHGDWILAAEATGDEDGFPAVALEERDELVLGDPREYRRVRDLVAVQVQDRQHGAVSDRVEELVRVPARGERPGLRLAIPDDARYEQLRIVEGGAEGVHERVAELAALVDRARRFRRRVARDAAGERELAEELA